MTETSVEIGVKHFDLLSNQNISNKRSVTKERLCEWIKTLCFTLNRFDSAHLEIAVERIGKLSMELVKE